MRKVDSFKILSSCQLLCCICKRPLSSELMLTSKPKLLSTFPTHSIELAGGLLWVWRTLCIENSLRRKNATWCIGVACLNPQVPSRPPQKMVFHGTHTILLLFLCSQWLRKFRNASSLFLLTSSLWCAMERVCWKRTLSSFASSMELESCGHLHTVIKLPFDLSEC